MFDSQTLALKKGLPHGLHKMCDPTTLGSSAEFLHFRFMVILEFWSKSEQIPVLPLTNVESPSPQI